MNTNIETLVVELNGVEKSLFMLGNLFGDKNKGCSWDNDTICDALNSIAYHIGRISDDLSTVSVQK